MSGVNAGLKAHLDTGITHVCRCWAVTRRDGVTLGFTDHDCDLAFEGIEFRADTGLSALALQQSTGLSVDNTEALGALSDAAIREEDIEAGRFDGAEVRAWMVNWADTGQRQLQFRGSIGELKRAGGAFEAELRGLTDVLNVPMGRVYQKPCSAVLGDGACGFDTGDGGVFRRSGGGRGRRAPGVPLWPVGGVCAGVVPSWRVADAKRAGARAERRDQARPDRGWRAGDRAVASAARGDCEPGDSLRLIAGCDKRMETCRLKFRNLLNFQGFPDIPGDDWSITDPARAGTLRGGSRRG